MKRCSKCGIEKPLEDFKRDRAKKSGYGSWCLVCVREKSLQWRKANPDKVKDQNSRPRDRKEYKYSYNRKYYSANREKIIAHNSEYAKANPERKKIWVNNRRARKKAATIIPITEVGLAGRLAYYGGKCWICKVNPHEHWDHIKPLSKGGAHILANLRPSCASCNLSKSDKWPL